mmetsp:Transcript_34091/g.25161  ORF Transcript_34091/g.25161 Transcript_34091/m.25161 type:complete len:117 (-) Transcript_34091:1750-2100(-)
MKLDFTPPTAPTDLEIGLYYQQTKQVVSNGKITSAWNLGENNLEDFYLIAKTKGNMLPPSTFKELNAPLYMRSCCGKIFLKFVLGPKGVIKNPRRVMGTESASISFACVPKSQFIK